MDNLVVCVVKFCGALILGADCGVGRLAWRDIAYLLAYLTHSACASKQFLITIMRAIARVPVSSSTLLFISSSFSHWHQGAQLFTNPTRIDTCFFSPNVPSRTRSLGHGIVFQSRFQCCS